MSSTPAVPGSTGRDSPPWEAQGGLAGWSSLSLGGDGVEIGAVALQEHSREKQNKNPVTDSLDSLLSRVQVLPTMQAELQKRDLRVTSEPFPSLVRDFSHLSGKC